MLKNIKRQALLTTLLILLPLKCFSSLLYWNLFNIEGESSQSSVYVTYAAFEDMLNDENRLGSFLPDSFGASQNVVGSGSDGTNYWSLFNIEGESSQGSVYVTYASLMDMLIDENRLGTFLPDSFGASQNVVGSGAFVLTDSAVVPEPGVLWLMLSGLAGIMLVTTRKPSTPRFLQ